MGSQFKIRSVPSGTSPTYRMDGSASASGAMGRRETFLRQHLPFAQSVCASCYRPSCCYQIVAVTEAEAEAILVMGKGIILRDNGIGLLRLAEQARDEIEASAEDDDETASRYFLKGRPCAFLTPEGRCGIYAGRPDACATHLLLEGTVDGCAHKESEAGEPVNDPNEQGYLDASTARELLMRARAKNDGTLTIYSGLALALLSVVIKNAPSAGAFLRREGFGDVASRL